MTNVDKIENNIRIFVGEPWRRPEADRLEVNLEDIEITYYEYKHNGFVFSIKKDDRIISVDFFGHTVAATVCKILDVLRENGVDTNDWW